MLNHAFNIAIQHPFATGLTISDNFVTEKHTVIFIVLHLLQTSF